MAISPDIESGPFTGNGAQVAFPFAFTAMSEAEVTVEVEGTVQSAGFTVALADNGGTVTFDTPPATGAQVTLRSSPDYLQDSVFENEGAYNLATVNAINRRAAVRSLVIKQRFDALAAVAKGDPGPPNALTIGTVTKIAPGGTPTVSLTGTSPAQVLNIGLVTGDKGDPGADGLPGTLATPIDVASYAAAFKAAIGPTANLRILSDFEGSRVAYSGSPTILTELDSLDDSPVALTVHTTISSVPNPRPIYTAGRGLFFSSQAGLQNTTTQIFTGTANSWAFLGSWDLNVPLLSSTVTHQSDLASLGGVEGDMAKVIGDTRSNLSPDLLNVLDQDTASFVPVNGFYRNVNGTFGTNEPGYLFAFRKAANAKYLRGRINRLGQFYLEIYQGTGTTVYQVMSKGAVPMLGKLNVAIYADRNRGLTLIVNGVRLYARDVAALPDLTDLTDMLLNGSDRTANPVLPITSGFRHYYRGHAVVQSLPFDNFMKAQEVFMKRHGAPVWTRPAALSGVINAGQSHAGGYFNISDTWTTAAGYNGTVTVPNTSYDIGLRSPTREAAPNLLAHNAAQLNGGQTPYADIGPFNIRAANNTGFNPSETHAPTQQGEAYILGWLKQINAHIDGAAREWIIHQFCYPGISLNQLFSEPNTYLPSEYKTANIGLFELVAGLKQQIILARDYAKAHGQKYTCDLMNWFHGHADAKITGFNDNASYATQFLAFYDTLNAWIKMVCDQTHDVTVIMIPPDYSQMGRCNNTIAQCQRMLDIEATRGTRPIYMGPSESAFTSFIHNDPLGQRAIGEGYGLAARRVLLDGERYPSIVPYAYTYTVGGTTIDIDYRVRTGEALSFRDSNGRNILARQTDSGVDTYGYGYFQKSADVTISIASPGVITWNAHGRANGSLVRLDTLGALPTGLTPGVDYYVVNATANSFQLSATNGGSAINTSGTQAGVHTAYDVSVKIASVAITSTNRVRVTLAAPIVSGAEVQYCGFNCRVGNLASNTPVAGLYHDQDFSTLVSGSPVLAESASFNDLTLIANSSRKVLT